MKFSIGEKYNRNDENHRGVDKQKFVHATLPQSNTHIFIIPIISTYDKCSAALIQNGAAFDFSSYGFTVYQLRITPFSSVVYFLPHLLKLPMTIFPSEPK